MPEAVHAAAALDAAAALLLREPDERVARLVADWSGAAVALGALRQDFYDVMCIPQSGRYVPAFEHVVRRARRDGTLWIFPPPRFDGGLPVESYYGRLGFDRGSLDVAPVFRARHLPGDHLGIMLAFAAFALRAYDGRERDARAGREFAMFSRRHLDAWVETYALLLEDRGGAYLNAVASAVREAVTLVRNMTAPPAAVG